VPGQLEAFIHDESLFKLINSKSLRVNNMVEGVNDYFPLLSTGECASLFNCLIHSTVVEFKSRKVPLWKMPEDEAIHVQRLKEVDEHRIQHCPKTLGEFMFKSGANPSGGGK
jgi:hypothetical protein